MDWVEISTILGPFLVITGWLYNRLEKRFDRIDKQFEKIDESISNLRKDIQSLETRVARIEGQLAGPPRWEPRIKEKERNK